MREGSGYSRALDTTRRADSRTALRHVAVWEVLLHYVPREDLKSLSTNTERKSSIGTGMARRSRATAKGKAHSFGGDWTSKKLAVVEKYLSAYLDALKNQPFKTAYIDAFAGTGYR